MKQRLPPDTHHRPGGDATRPPATDLIPPLDVEVAFQRIIILLSMMTEARFKELVKIGPDEWVRLKAMAEKLGKASIFLELDSNGNAESKQLTPGSLKSNEKTPID